MKLEEIKLAYKLKRNIPVKFVAQAIANSKEMLLNYMLDNNINAVNKSLINQGFKSLPIDADREKLNTIIDDLVINKRIIYIQQIINDFSKSDYNLKANNWTTNTELNKLLIESFK